MPGFVTRLKIVTTRLLLMNSFNPIIDARNCYTSSVRNPILSYPDCLKLGNLSSCTGHLKSHRICLPSRPGIHVRLAVVFAGNPKFPESMKGDE